MVRKTYVERVADGKVIHGEAVATQHRLLCTKLKCIEEYNTNTTIIRRAYAMTQLIRTWIAKKEEVIMKTFRDIVDGIYNAEILVMGETWKAVAVQSAI